MGKVASGIAHDMNNIFGIIIGFSVERDRLPVDDSPDDDLRAVAEAMDGIESAARRGASVCRKLLAFSRHDMVHLEVFDVVSALGGIFPLIRKVLPQMVQLKLHVLDDEIPSIRSQPVRARHHQFSVERPRCNASRRYVHVVDREIRSSRYFVYRRHWYWHARRCEGEDLRAFLHYKILRRCTGLG